MLLTLQFQVVLLVSCFFITFSQLRKGDLSKTAQNDCIGQKTCGECIAVGKGCAWCQDPNYMIENKERCNQLSEHGSCPKQHIVFPESSLQKTQDDVPTDGGGTQIQPQIINLKLRPRDPQKFNVTFRVGRDYPLDLYYLMDMSYSMLNDKVKLASLASALGNRISSVSTDYRLGFGTFVDKPVMPFVTKTGNTVDKPCPECVNPYGFKHHLSLMKDPVRFQQEVTNAAISGSLDSPEGGMDALMQAIVCQSEIGWRSQSRRVLLFSSDAASHLAGDGKLGGIVKPFDGNCHLSNGEYSQSTNLDYPSLSQIATQVADKSINTIFAVTENQTSIYQQIQKFILGSTIEKLADDSSNIVDLISQVYSKMSSKVEMVSSGAGDVIIRYFSRCLNPNGPLQETNKCENLKIGDSVTFEVEIEAKECPKDPNGFSQQFDIKPVGLQDRLQVRMELHCKCDCENDPNKNVNDPLCNSNGALVCGACVCNDKYYGKTCNCFTGNVTQAESNDKCKSPETGTICSNNGECVCGTCECRYRRANSEEKYSGKYCQCDDYSCPFYNNALCGGSEHGKCECGSCSCTPAFNGEDCGCSTKTDACVDSKGTLCGGPARGVCECNQCKCLEDSQYQGQTCEDCKYCDLVCRQHKDCVQCVVFGTGELKDDCLKCKSRDYIKIESSLPESSNTCEFKDENDCIFFFTYEYDKNNEIQITAQRTAECPKTVNVGAIVGIVIGVLVLIGIVALVAWKAIITLKDRRELAAFLKEAEKGEWAREENPVFKPATTKYNNPMYKKGTLKATETPPLLDS